MKLLRLNDTDSTTNFQVSTLQDKLRVIYPDLMIDGYFGEETDFYIRKFQTENNLVADGLVGFLTWDALLWYGIPNGATLNTFYYSVAADLLDCDIFVIKAVKEVETGNLSAFDFQGRPRILFEGHIFWNRLKAYGIDPKRYNSKYPSIVYQKWDKTKYTKNEWNRLELARTIHKSAADESASWGMFQIMGMNYASCYFNNVDEFVAYNMSGEVAQLRLFIRFIYKSKLGKYLRDHNWSGFANGYNGPGYKLNKYDEKLLNAYNKYKLFNNS